MKPNPDHQSQQLENDLSESSSFTQHVDIESLLQQEEHRALALDHDHHDNDDNHTAISSLPPFGDGIITTRKPSFGDFSSVGSSLGNLMDTGQISIDDDSECGPVPSYPPPAAAAAASSSPSSHGRASPSDNLHSNKKTTKKGIGRPNEVYINASNKNIMNNHHKNSNNNPESSYTPGRLSAFMGISRRHKTSDASVGGSSMGSKNSLSSIFESMGYLKRTTRRPHPSRGLTKRRDTRGAGAFYRFVTGSPEPRPTSFENEREEFLYRQREARMVNLRAFILMLFLICILISVIELSSISSSDGSHLRPNKKKGNQSLTSINSNDEIDERNQHHVYNSISMNLVRDGVPKDDGRPAFLHNDQGKGQGQIIDRLKNSQQKAIMNNLCDIETSSSSNKSSECTPLLWNIPQSGNEMIREIFSSCQSFKIAAEWDHDDINNPNLKNSRLQVFKENQNNQAVVINVDLSSSSGIKRAKTMNLVASKLADLVISPIFEESVTTLFDKSHMGKAFTIMRDPVDRLSSLSKHLQRLHDPNVAGKKTIQAFALSQYVESNWMVRNLIGKFNVELTDDDLDLAKHILKRKFIIGLYEEEEASMKRFYSYFGVSKGDSNIECRDSTLKRWQSIKENSSTLSKSERISLELQNKLDIELYNYAKQLYLTQGKNIFAK